MRAFNAAERRVLEWIARHQADGEDIAAQLATARLTSRENDGQGFHTGFEVVHEPRHRLAPRYPVAEAWAHVRGLKHGMMFLLWADADGYIKTLEGAGFGEDVSGFDFEAAQIDFYAAPPGPFVGFRPVAPSWTHH